MLFPLPKSSVQNMFSDTFGADRPGGREHHGTDISVQTGTPIYAVEPGSVYRTGNNSLDGNFIILQGSSGFKYRYSHLSAVDVVGGQAVKAGSTLGKTGATGNAAGPHLHFGMTDTGGAAVNPYDALKQAYEGNTEGVTVIDEPTPVEDSTANILGLKWSWYDAGAVLLGVAGVVIIAYRLISQNIGGGAVALL